MRTITSMNCPRCGYANPEGFKHCGMCGAPLPPSEKMSVFGVAISPEEDEPYLIYQFWFEDRPRYVTKSQHQTNQIISAAAFAFYALVLFGAVGLWGVLLASLVILVTVLLAYLSYKKARARALEESARRRDAIPVSEPTNREA